MITRRRPTIFDIFFALRGSILPRIALRMAVIAAIACAAVVLVRSSPATFGAMSAIPFTLIGIALSIFMSFRNNACYDRWWEGRKLWGQMLVDVRSFARAVAHLDEATRGPLLLGLCGFVNGLGARVRDRPEADAIAPWAPAAHVDAMSSNPTDAALRDVGRRCTLLARHGTISDMQLTILEARLVALSGVQAGCERIHNAPLPFAYSLLLHRTAYLFCTLLPFALAGNLGWWTPPIAVIVCYTFFGLDALGDELENPFGSEPNDLPLDAMIRTAERELLAAAGRTDLPPALRPVDDLLM